MLSECEREKHDDLLADLHHVLGLFFDVRKLVGSRSIKLPKRLKSFLCSGALHQGLFAENFSAEEKKQIDHQDILGLTPLHYAMMYAHPSFVEELVASGAETSLVSKGMWVMRRARRMHLKRCLNCQEGA